MLASDLRIGSFSNDAPWLVSPETMPWRAGIDELRRSAAAEVPRLISRRRLPAWRAMTIALRILVAVVPWYLRRLRHRDADSAVSLARALRLAFERLGPTFIKLGQLIASAEGMLPSGWVEEFKLCRDRVPPEMFGHVRAVVESEFGKPLEDIFCRFDPVPIAAASIGQVHAARLHSGEDVVVKVQRPGIDRVIVDDVATLTRLAPLVERWMANMSFVNLPAYVELFADTIVEELDFRLEAQNMLDVASVLATVEPRSIIVPRPHPELVSRRVLVMERIVGLAMDDEAALEAADIDAAPVFRALTIAFLEGSMVYGVFHGDLHGGNMAVCPNGQPVIFDFGITGRFDQSKRSALLGLLATAATGDGAALLGHFRDLGGLSPDVDIKAVAQDVRIDDLLAQSDEEMSPELVALRLRESLHRIVAHGGRLPKPLFLFVKGMVYLSGAVSRMAADVDIFAEMGHLYEAIAINHAETLSAVIDLENLPDIDTIKAQLSKQVGAAGNSAMTFAEIQAVQKSRNDEMFG